MIKFMNSIDVNYADFRRLDLNLLVAFDAMLQERHVGRAAERLFIGQPAMSHALARLRTLFDDALFVRTGKRMEPTALALALGPRVRAWLAEGAGFLVRTAGFDATKAEGQVRVSIPDGLEALILPPLMARLRAQAPGIRVKAQLIEVDQLLPALDDDAVDMVVAAVALPLRSWHPRAPLMSSRFNCLYAPEQLTLPRPLSLAALARLDHVVSSHRGDAASVVDHVFATQGLSRHVVASSTSMIAILHMLKQAPLVSIQPAIYSPLYDLSDMEVVPLRTSPPMVIDIDLVWHSRYQQQPLHAYVRDHIRRITSTMCPKRARTG